MQLQFLGANRQVTGSCYVLETGELRLMVDCGLFQERQVQERNWRPLPIEPRSIDYLLLTHAHLDHSGLIPRLVANGFNGTILATEPTVELARIIMNDSARIHEEDVKYKARRHRKERRKSQHGYAPLYTVADAQQAGEQIEGVKYDESVELSDHVHVTYHEAGHILGSSILNLSVRENGSSRRIIFSGDLGQCDKPLIRDPSLLTEADYVVMESTYGDRNHKDAGDVADQLGEAINDTAKRGGNVVIPTFAVERAQELMYHLSHLVHADRIPDLPVFMDSPMAVDVTEVFRRHRDYMDAETQQLFASDQAPLRFPGLKLVRRAEESKAINTAGGSNIILASSGMCTGGRIKHHLRHNISRADSTILFVGYQAHGTLGRLIVDGRPEVRIHGRNYPVKAKIAQIHGFSAHADRDDLLRWLGHYKQTPRHIYLTHGEEDAAFALRRTIESRFSCSVSVPEYQQTATLE